MVNTRNIYMGMCIFVRYVIFHRIFFKGKYTRFPKVVGESKKHIHIMDFHNQGSWLIICTSNWLKWGSTLLFWHNNGISETLSWCFCPPLWCHKCCIYDHVCTDRISPFIFSYGNIITMNLRRHWHIFFWHLTVHVGLAWHLRASSGWH